MSINILLCGFMGAGKGHLLQACRNELSSSFSFFDLDEQLALFLKIHPQHLGEWMNSFGIEAFRQKEAEVFFYLMARPGNKMISLGGGALETTEVFNESQLHELVFLHTPFEICFERIKNDVNRPLAYAKNKEELFSLYQQRLVKYQRAKYTLETYERENVVTSKTLVHNLVKTLKL